MGMIYDIVSSSNEDNFVRDVNEWIKKGYEPQGGVSIVSGKWY